MTLNLDKNKAALVHAWKEVLDDRNPINWALFGYDGQTYDLNTVSKGDAGLEELQDEFNSGKIQYALCKVKIKEKNVEKVVLINWQGEGAPLARKGMCANHLEQVKSFFKGIHLHINARTDEDVEPELVLQMVSKAICGEGVKMSSMVEPEIGPVGSNYKRVNPMEEINSKAKDDFWRKEEQEEERRKREEQNRFRKFSQDEVKLLRKESQDYFDKEEQELAKQKAQNHLQKISPVPQTTQTQQNGNISPATSNGYGGTYGKSNSTSPVPPTPTTPTGTGAGAGNIVNSAERVAALQASMPMKSTNQSQLVRQRMKSFDGGSGPVFPTSGPKVNGSSTTTSNHTGIIKKSPSPTPTQPTVAKSSAPVIDNVSVLKRKQLFESGNSPTSATNTVIKRNPAEEIRQMQEEMKRQQQKEQQQVEKEITKAPPMSTIKSIPDVANVEVSPVAHYQSNVVEESIPAAAKAVAPKSPQTPEDNQQKISPAFFSNPSNARTPSPQPQTIYNKQPEVVIPEKTIIQPDPAPPEIIADATIEEPEEDTSIHSAQDSYGGNSNSMATVQSVSPLPDNDSIGETITIEITPDMGTCARALYDYQAADETEITFDPGEIITNIEKIDEGWWEGLGPGGQYGLFPANYVELLN